MSDLLEGQLLGQPAWELHKHCGVELPPKRLLYCVDSSTCFFASAKLGGNESRPSDG